MFTRAFYGPTFLLVVWGSLACTPSLHIPRAGDHYRGTAASATQSNHGINDGRLAFELEVHQAALDGSFGATITVTEARLSNDGSLQSGDALVGKQFEATFDGTGRLQ